MLFKKLESFESTRPAVLCMNDFFKLALSRQAQELETAPPETATSASAEGSAVVGVGGGGAPRRRSIRA